MTDDVLDRVERALDGTTPEPWALEIVDGFPVAHQHYHYDSADEWYDVDGPNGGWLAHCQDITDAAFIAASRSLVVELVDALRAARTENERMYGFIHRLGHIHTCEHPHAAPGDTWQCPNCQRTWKALEWGPLDIRWETTR